MKGLGRDQFEVYDEKMKEQIAHFAAGTAPVSIGIVCEIHSARPEKARAMLIALKQFTRGLGNDDDFFFTAFGTQGSVTTEFVPSAIGFYAAGHPSKNSWHRIRVTLKQADRRRGLSLSYRQGYRLASR